MRPCDITEWRDLNELLRDTSLSETERTWILAVNRKSGLHIKILIPEHDGLRGERWEDARYVESYPSHESKNLLLDVL
jgi:hypothetical protein